MNKFGKIFSFTSFGESHGKALGCVVDGVPAGLRIDESFMQNELDKRKPGQNKYSTSRNEEEKLEILSGVFEGFSTGTPICMIVFNTNQKSSDYDNVKDLFRPSHADFTYHKKYNIRDYRGGGRSSARETLARVLAGSIAKLILKQLNIEILSGVYSVAEIKAKKCDFEYAKQSEIYSLDNEVESLQKEKILQARKAHDSLGSSVKVVAKNVPAGLGEPIYYKLDGALADSFMGINGVKAVEIGEGIKMSKSYASKYNDEMNTHGFLTNFSGGVQGGISNGALIVATLYFKPTPSIFKPQKTIDLNNKEVICNLKGRHDPCIGIRGSIVASSMMAICLCDMLLLNLKSQMSNIKNFYI